MVDQQFSEGMVIVMGVNEKLLPIRQAKILFRHDD